VDLTQLVGAAGVIEDALGRGGLARVDMRGNPDVPHFVERYRSRHISSQLSAISYQLSADQQTKLITDS
jgi:hypothetical protein